MAEAAAVAATAVVASAAGRNLRTFLVAVPREADLRGLLVDALHDQVKWVLLELSFEES